MAIEILSRQGFAYPLKNKSATATQQVMRVFLQEYKKRFYTLPKLIQFDEGKEFINKDMTKFLESQDISFFTTASERKATVVERLNRTIKEKLTKLFERNNNHIWYTYIQDIMTNYNTQENRDIQEKPVNVNEDNKYLIWGRLYGHIAEFKKPKYKVGDFVRVLKFTPHLKGKEYQKYYRETHEKRINPKTGKPVREYALGARDKSPFSDEVFKIQDVLIGDPVVYKLYSVEAGVEILGKFYESELSLVRK